MESEFIHYKNRGKMQGRNSFYISSAHVLINNLKLYYYIRKLEKKKTPT